MTEPTATEIVQAWLDKIAALESDNEQLQDALFRFTVVEDDGLPDKPGEYLFVHEDSPISHEMTISQVDIESGEFDYMGKSLIAWAEKPTYTP